MLAKASTFSVTILLMATTNDDIQISETIQDSIHEGHSKSMREDN